MSIPCLRKDFTVDSYMIYEAKLLGASAVLLICSLLGEEKLKEYLSLCDELGLSALVEAHDGAELSMALRAKARIVGVNNRNLKDFTVDTDNTKDCGPGAAGGRVYFRKRDQDGRGGRGSEADRGKWSADRRNLNAFGG